MQVFLMRLTVVFAVKIGRTRDDPKIMEEIYNIHRHDASKNELQECTAPFAQLC